MIVRAAQPADLEAVAAIAGESPEAPRWQASAYATFLHPGGGTPPLLRAAFVAASGAEILGFAAASLLLDGQENRCELESIAVRPRFRGQGAGTALLQAVLDWTARSGGRRLALEVRAGNAPALRLYQRLGLRRQGQRPRYYTDPEEDALLLDMLVTPVPAPGGFSTGKEVEDRLPRC